VTDRKTLKTHISKVEPGWILGKDVCSDEGTVLLSHDTILTEYSLARLQEWNVDIVDVLLEGPCLEPFTKPAPIYSNEDGVFLDMYERSIGTIANLFTEMKTSKMIPLQEFKPIAESVLGQVLGVRGVLTRLRQVKSGDEYTFNHSLNVGIYSALIGSWMNYDETALRQLAMAGLLHDTGKAKISMDILGKPGPLTADEFEIMKRHSLLGYQMIKATAGIAYEVGMAVLQHHERENGTGYPLKLTSENITPFAKIIAVADAYDAITSDRIYKAKRTSYMAADIIREEGFKTFDPMVVQSFLERITASFYADRVRLSNGMIGTIVSVNSERPTRPLIKTDQGFIDLDKIAELNIIEIL